MGQSIWTVGTADCTGSDNERRYFGRAYYKRQSLLTTNTELDLFQRTRYLNAVNTFNELLSMGVVPIVNENDTVSVSVSCAITTVNDPSLLTNTLSVAGNQIWRQ
jgi:hypothetical protein